MRHLVGLLLVGLLLGVARTSYAEELNSSFGFTAQVPEGWIIFSRAELRENSDLFEGIAELPGFGDADSRAVAQIEAQIRAGKIEVLFRTAGSEPGFVDNINVVKQIGRLPSASGADAYCKSSGAELAKVVGRSLEFYECSAANGLSSFAIYTEFEGIVPGTRSMQFQIRKSQNVMVVVTATASNGTADDVRPDLHSMAKSLRFE